MGLEDFISSDDDINEKEYHRNNILDEERLFKDDMCPNCGNVAEHIRGSEYRCKTDSSECSVLYYFTNNFSNNNA